MPQTKKTQVLLGKLLEKRRSYLIPKATRLSKIGHGKEGVVYHNIILSKKGVRRVAEKRYYTELGDPFVSPKKVKRKIIAAKKTWRMLKDAGLPTPSFYVPLRRGQANLFRILMEDLERKHGRIEPINENREPTFLRKLSISRDSILIKNLASDLAVIHSLGFCPEVLDAWIFYKSGNSFNRVLADYGNLNEVKNNDGFWDSYKKSLPIIKKYLKRNFGKKEYALFMREYTRLFATPIKKSSLETA